MPAQKQFWKEDYHPSEGRGGYAQHGGGHHGWPGAYQPHHHHQQQSQYQQHYHGQGPAYYPQHEGKGKQGKNQKSQKGKAGQKEQRNKGERPFVPTGGAAKGKKKEALFGDSFERGFHVPARLVEKSDDFISTVNDWHFAMLNDFPRNEHYRSALQAVIKPNETVCLEIGAGSGILSCIAASLGAKKVIAIEANKHLVRLSREIIEKNGFSDRVTIIEGMSDKMDLEDLGLDEKPDVLVSELFGTLLLSESALTYIADARENLLKKDARIVPQRATQFVQLVMSEDLVSLTSAREWGGFCLEPFNHFIDTASLVFSKVFGFRFSTLNHTFLSDPVSIMAVDFEKDEMAKGKKHVFEVVPTKSGVVHAVMASWEAQSEGAEPMSTHPDKTRDNLPRDMHWGQGLQLIEDNSKRGETPVPFEVTAGVPIQLTVRFAANLVTMQFQLDHIKGSQQKGSNDSSREEPSQKAETAGEKAAETPEKE